MKRLLSVLTLVLPAAAALPVSGAGAADLPALKAVAPLYLPASLVPGSAWFAGLGGSVASQSYESQNIFAQGVSDIFLGGTQVAFGTAGGPTTPSLGTQTAFAPTAQLGFFQHFGGSNWLWGAKVTYSYLNMHGTDDRVRDPQVGSFTSANSNTFTGNVVIGSYQSGITHQINFIPFVGHSFERSMLYAGIGPSLSQVKSSLNNVVGFAAINGTHVNITGQPSNFSSTQWVLGGAATVGGSYFLDRGWFVDMNYTFGITKNQTSNFSAPFASATDGYTDTGILSGNWSGHIITQAVAVSINKAF